MAFSPLHSLRQHADRWLFRHRGVERGEVFLSQRRIFILPSRAGVAYAAMLLVLFIGSVNYNLSMGFSLTFMLAACALIDMHLTFRNLAHLHLVPGRGGTVFAGDDASFELYIANRRKHGRHAIGIGFMMSRPPAVDGQPAVTPIVQCVDVEAGTQCSVTLNAPAGRRGWMQAPRVRLSTSFPLGLLTAWSYWHPDLRVLVYPRPSDDPRPLPQAAEQATESDGSGQAGDEDFAGIRPFQPGDSLKRLAWRQIARLDAGNGALVSKHFEGGAASELRLDFAALPVAMGLEERLSCMARWVIEAEALALPYAFALEHIRYAPALGAAHQEACLRALALYGETA